MATFLYSRDSKDKIRVQVITTVKFKGYWEIRRKSGLIDGKLTEQPIITVNKGKVNRTTEEQTKLEFRSIVNSQRDKGYKALQELFPDLADQVTIDPLDKETIEAVLELGKTYGDGIQKLMLAKDPKAVKSKKGFDWDKEWWVSRKLDGIRAAVFYDLSGNLTAMSRNGKYMNAAFTDIFKSEKWKSFFDKLSENVEVEGDDVVRSSIMVDGELYIHGVPLSTLSGLSQMIEYDEHRHSNLEFWIFDFADNTRNAAQRATLLNSLQGHFDLKEDKICINEQIQLNEEFAGIEPWEGIAKYNAIKRLHDTWVSEGFEGAICRDGSRTYGYGTRDDRMVKIKEFDETEFEIIGLNNENMRPEDMTFKCVLPGGGTFDSKPHGTRAMKLQFIRDFDNIIGKMMTVKHFGYTPDNVPFINTGKAIRDYE